MQIRIASFLFFLFHSSLVMGTDMEFHVVAKKSRISFISETSLFDVKGDFSTFSATATVPDSVASKSQASVKVEVKSLDTGISRRDRHLRSDDFFYVEKFPHATFKTTKIESKNGKILVSGALKIRGVEKSISLPVTLEPKELKGHNQFRVKGTFVVNRRDFGINYDVVFFLPAIRDKATVEFDLLFQRK